MTKLIRNDSPGALTLEQARELEIKRRKERQRQAAASSSLEAVFPAGDV